MNGFSGANKHGRKHVYYLLYLLRSHVGPRINKIILNAVYDYVMTVVGMLQITRVVVDDGEDVCFWLYGTR